MSSAKLKSSGTKTEPKSDPHMNVLGMGMDDRDRSENSDWARNASFAPSHSSGKSASKVTRVQMESSFSDVNPGAAALPINSAPLIADHTTTNARRQHDSARSQTTVTHHPSGPVPLVAEKPGWWVKMIWGNSATEDEEDEDDASLQYQALEPPENLPQRSASVGTALTRTSNTTVEDRIKEDCQFFYQGVGDHLQRRSRLPGRRGLQPLASALHHQMPRMLSARADARFRQQYERLNQDFAFADTDDLFLEEGDTGHHRTSGNRRGVEYSSAVATSQNVRKLSTLFFEQDGRLLMKLPRDQIRLIVDQDLEPGIISVEQWRKVDKDSFDPVGPAVAADEEEGGLRILEEEKETNGTRVKQPPPLTYVMTVPDDLYRRVVSEMSYALLPPWWGFFMCCNETGGQADIRLALAILAVVFILMFASTLEWPTV